MNTPSGSFGSPSFDPKMPTRRSSLSKYGCRSSYEIGQSSPRPSRLFRRKSSGPKRSEMRPQWFVRPPSIRARNQSNVVPGAFVNGSPSRSQPPMQPSNSPNGLLGVLAPRRGESYDHAAILESFAESHMPPASSRTTLAPASHSTFAAMPPPAPDPTIQTSYVSGRLMICTGPSYCGLRITDCGLIVDLQKTRSGRLGPI